MNLLEIQKDSNDYERFISKITIKGSGCWEVGGPKNGGGYASMYIPTSPLSSQTEMAHRYSYKVHKGEIPEGLVIDHLCKNRCCANPEHLECVTHLENVRRGNGAKVLREIHASKKPEERRALAKHANSFNMKKLLNRAKCRNGHDVTPETTSVNSKNGVRRCKICLSISNARFLAKSKKEF